MLVDELINNSTFKVIVDSIYNGIVVIDKQGTIIVFNKAAEKITGTERSQALHRPIKEIIPNSNLVKV